MKSRFVSLVLLIILVLTGVSQHVLLCLHPDGSAHIVQEVQDMLANDSFCHDSNCGVSEGKQASVDYHKQHECIDILIGVDALQLSPGGSSRDLVPQPGIFTVLEFDLPDRHFINSTQSRLAFPRTTPLQIAAIHPFIASTVLRI